jgi:6,7-dimethyl-8-ribityllumazine synthase
MDQPTPFSEMMDGTSIGIVASRFNQKLVDQLLDSVVATLSEYDVLLEDIEIVRVPGANEIPYALHLMATREEFDCLIGLGVVLAGDTSHHEVIAHATAQVIQQLAVNYDVPIINGIIAVETQQQAVDRCGPKMNRGREFAQSAMEMVIVTNNHLDKLMSEIEDGSDWDDLLGDPDEDQWKS